MKRSLVGLFALLLMQTISFTQEATFYLGTYTGPGKADGILVGRLNTETGKLSPISLAAPANSPSYVALSPDGKYLYAALEAEGGAVGAFRVEADGKLASLNQMPSGGAGACHVWVAANHVFVANYQAGNISAFPIQKDGSLGESTDSKQFTGSGPDVSRQKGPHAHGVITAENGKYVYVCDLGTDNVWSYSFSEETGKLTATEPPSGKVPPGGGPRHMALSADEKFLFVNNEMGMSTTVFQRDLAKGTLTLVQTVSTLAEGTTLDPQMKTSEIVTHPSGKWLYVSNRGHESIAVYAIAKDGKLTWLETAPVPLKTPRGFAIDPTGKWLLVGGQRSNSLVVLKIDPATGKLTDTGESAVAAVPVSVAFAPAP